jgi:hypothetical protein
MFSEPQGGRDYADHFQNTAWKVRTALPLHINQKQYKFMFAGFEPNQKSDNRINTILHLKH